MFEYLESISITEGEQIKKTIQALFRQTCILQVKYDPATLVPKDNVQYEICVRHRHFIEDYLSVLGCELTHDAQEHIFCLTGDGAAREKLNMTETVILLIIKLIYKDKIMGEGLNAPVTTLKEMREYGKNTNLIVRKLKESFSLSDAASSDHRRAGSGEGRRRRYADLYLQYDQSVCDGERYE